jgi:glycosyltransferase involved in cell wall biosynthesis
MGLIVALYSTDVRTRNFYLIKSIKNALLRDIRIESVYILTIDNIVRECFERKFDILLAIGGAGAVEEPLKRALQLVRKSALWTTEDPYELTRNRAIGKNFDVVFTNDKHAAAHYSPPAIALPLAASLEFHDAPPLGGSDLLTDLFFVGTAWPERVELLSSLIVELPTDLRKKIGLSGNMHLPGFHLGNLDLITNFRLAPREFSAMANRSAVTLTIDRAFSSSHSQEISSATPPPRLFEMALSGTAQVYLTQKDGISEYFVPDQEIVLARTPQEAAKAIRLLSSDRNLRDKIAHGAYRRAKAEHLYDNRVKVVVDTLIAAEDREKKVAIARRPRVLRVTHNVAGIQPFGGVELYQETQEDGMQQFDFYTFFPDRRSGNLALKLPSGEIIKTAAVPSDDGTISDRLHEQEFYRILSKYNFDIIHYNHLIGHPLALPHIGFALGIPSVLQIHDYYSLCREFTLVGIDGRFCGVRDSNTVGCDICLSVRGIAPPGAQARRRHIMQSVLERMDLVIHNTQYTYAKFKEIYPNVEVPHRVIGNTSSAKTLRRLIELPGNSSRLRLPSWKLSIGILGNFSTQKGGEVLTRIFWQMRGDPINFKIIGRVDEHLLSGLQAGNFANVEIIGQYDQDSLPALLEGVDVSVHFSIWPETYCISVDEARAAGVVPIVLGLGALAERVQHGVNGIVVDPQYPSDLILELRRLSTDPELLDRLRTDSNLALDIHREHFFNLDEIYQNLMDQRRMDFPVHDVGEEAAALYLSDMRFRFNSNNWKTGNIEWDEGLSNKTLLAVEIEKNVRISSPRQLINLRDEDFDKSFFLNDEPLSIIVDEVELSFEEDKAIIIPSSHRELSIAVVIPLGMNRIPISVGFVSGDKSTEFRLEGAVGAGLGGEAAIFACKVPTSELIGTFGLFVTFLFGEGIRRRALKARAIVGEYDQLYVPMKTPRNSVQVRRKSVATHIRGFLNRSQNSGVTVHVDDVNGVAVEPESTIHFSRNKNPTVRVRGWAVPINRSDEFEVVFLELDSGQNKLEFPARMQLRPDVASHFGTSAFLRSGIDVVATINHLPTGTYSVRIGCMDSSGHVYRKAIFNLDISL